MKDKAQEGHRIFQCSMAMEAMANIFATLQGLGLPWTEQTNDPSAALLWYAPTKNADSFFELGVNFGNINRSKSMESGNPHCFLHCRHPDGTLFLLNFDASQEQWCILGTSNTIPVSIEEHEPEVMIKIHEDFPTELTEAQAFALANVIAKRWMAI